MRACASARVTLGHVAVTLLLLPAAGGADEVHLTSGGVVSGVIVEQTDEAVVLEAGPGRVTLLRSRIARVVESRSALATFQEHAAGVAPGDVEGLASLARWADDHDLATQARETWRRVLTLDPDHPEANAALGRTFLHGVWMDESDAHRAQGYVRYRERWVTPEEHEALVRERATEERAESDRREADLRVREAEARAREAEARAREAEALADQAEGPVEGIPYWWVPAGGGPIWPPGGVVPPPPWVRPEHPIARPPLPAHPPRGAPRSGESSNGQIQGQRPRPPRGGLSPVRSSATESKGTIGSGSRS
jgi:hypothetical protein